MVEALPYRLSLDPALEAFRPEIEYVCDFFDSCHFVRREQDASLVLHYGAEAPAGAVTVPAALFPTSVRLADDGIHPERDELRRIEKNGGAARLLPPPEDGPTNRDNALGYDAIGLIFFMLSRIEERDSEERDSYGRFPYAASLAARAGRLARPLADQAARDLAAALTGEERPANRTRYRVVPTHDVDRLRGYHSVLEPIRNAAGDVLKRRRPGAAMRRLRDAYFAGEPWRSVRDLMAASERRGLTSRFFFMGPSVSPLDSPYAQTMQVLLRRVVDEIVERGHEVGFHPGFATATDADEWSRQRRGLEDVLGRPVDEGRQHGLQFDVERTPAIWAEAGMRRDLTLGYPERVGFRNGTCRAHAAYGLCERRPLKLETMSTAIMEFGLFGEKYRNLSVDEALAECAPAIESCRQYGGTLVLLYHTGQTRPPLRTFYERLLDRAQ